MENEENIGILDTNTEFQHHEKSPNGSFWRRYMFVLCYFVTILCCCGIYYMAIYTQHSNFVEGQERIIRTHHEYLKNAQSTQTSANAAFRRQVQEYDNVQQEIKSLLELEFNRIQNEFESLEIWAGVLTVIFLIFSFYSLQKTEQMEHESREGMRRIKQIISKAEKKHLQFETDGNTKLSKFDSDSQSKLTTFDTEKSNRFSIFDTDKDNKLKEIEIKLEQTVNAFTQTSAEKLSGIEDKIAKAQKDILSENAKEIQQERIKAEKEFQKQGDNLRAGYVQEFKKLLEKYSKDLGIKYDEYKRELDAMLIDIRYYATQMNNQPDNEDVQDIRAQADLPNNDEE